MHYATKKHSLLAGLFIALCIGMPTRTLTGKGRLAFLTVITASLGYTSYKAACGFPTLANNHPKTAIAVAGLATAAASLIAHAYKRDSNNPAGRYWRVMCALLAYSAVGIASLPYTGYHLGRNLYNMGNATS